MPKPATKPLEKSAPRKPRWRGVRRGGAGRDAERRDRSVGGLAERSGQQYRWGEAQVANAAGRICRDDEQRIRSNWDNGRAQPAYCGEVHVRRDGMLTMSSRDASGNPLLDLESRLRGAAITQAASPSGSFRPTTSLVFLTFDYCADESMKLLTPLFVASTVLMPLPPITRPANCPRRVSNHLVGFHSGGTMSRRPKWRFPSHPARQRARSPCLRQNDRDVPLYDSSYEKDFNFAARHPRPSHPARSRQCRGSWK